MPKSSFHVDVDGFGFGNRYTYSAAEKQSIIDTAKSQKDVVLPLFGAVTAADVIISTLFPFIPPGTVGAAAGAALAGAFDNVIKAAIPGQQEGWCGGMSFAAMDYHQADWLSDRGFPAQDGADSVPECPGAPGALRAYIWQRHLDSLTSGGAAGTIEAILYLHVVKGGAETLLGKTKSEWAKLKQILDGGKPWPICVVGASLDPTKGHQVVAVGYDQTDAGHVAIHVYDVDVPYDPSTSDGSSTGTISLDLTGKTLSGSWPTGPTEVRAPCHFFCSSYTAKSPPVAVGVVSGVTGAASSEVTGAPMSVSYQAENVGFGPSVAFVPVMEAFRPEQSSHPSTPTVRVPVDPHKLQRMQGETVDTPPARPAVEDDVPQTSYTFGGQSGASAASLASGYIPNGDKIGAGASVSASGSTTLREGAWQYYAIASVKAADGSVVTRRLPAGGPGARADASSSVPFPKSAQTTGTSTGSTGTSTGAGGTPTGAGGHGTGEHIPVKKFT